MVSIVFSLEWHGQNQGHSCEQEKLRDMLDGLFAFDLGFVKAYGSSISIDHIDLVLSKSFLNSLLA